MTKIRIVIADDHKIFTNSLKTLLETDEAFEIVDEVFNGNDLILSIDLNAPQIVLLDIEMPEKNGLDILKHYYKKENAPKFIVISMYTDMVLLRKLDKFGAAAYLPKNLGREELMLTISDVINNKRQKQLYAEPIELGDSFNLLTAKEKGILNEIYAGMDNKQMAAKFFCSIFTIQTHRRNIHTKLGLKGQTALVNYVNLNMYRLL